MSQANISPSPTNVATNVASALREWYRVEGLEQRNDRHETHRKKKVTAISEEFSHLSGKLHLLFSLTADKKGIMVAATNNPTMEAIRAIQSLEINILGNGFAISRRDYEQLPTGAECRKLTHLFSVIEQFGTLNGNAREQRVKVQQMTFLATMQMSMQGLPIDFDPSQSAPVSATSTAISSTSNNPTSQNANPTTPEQRPFTIDSLMRLPRDVGRAVIRPGDNFFGREALDWPSGLGTTENGGDQEMIALLAEKGRAVIIAGFSESKCDPPGGNKKRPLKFKLMTILENQQDLYTGGVSTGAFVRGSCDWMMDHKVIFA